MPRRALSVSTCAPAMRMIAVTVWVNDDGKPEHWIYPVVALRTVLELDEAEGPHPSVTTHPLIVGDDQSVDAVGEFGEDLHATFACTWPPEEDEARAAEWVAQNANLVSIVHARKQDARQKWEAARARKSGPAV